MTRWGFFFVALWALVAAPALCAAGVLAHQCRCADGVCDHETGCEEDPCSEQVFRRSSSDASSEDPGAVPAPAAVLPGLERPAASPHVPPPAPHRALRPGAPHASDLPLLS